MIVPVKDDKGEYYYFGESYSFKVMNLDLEGDEK